MAWVSLTSMCIEYAANSNLKKNFAFQLQGSDTISGETDVKFQVSRDTLGAMLQSMAYIRKQLLDTVSIQFSICTVVPLEKLYVLT